MFAPHKADFPFKPMLFPVPAKVTVAALIWVYIFCKLMTEFPFIVKSPNCNREEAELVPAATVLLNIAEFPTVPPKTKAPCDPEVGAIVFAVRVPPAPIETVPLFFTAFAIDAPTTPKVAPLLTVTVPTPKAPALLAFKVPAVTVVSL